MNMDVIDLETIAETVKLISPTQCDFFGENCIVAMEMHNHLSGCVMNLAGEKNAVIAVNWSRKVNKAGYKEEKKVIEHAAEAIAFLLTPKITPYSVIEEATIGTGFEYWLGYDEEDENYDARNFLQARLEISGIKIESSNNKISQRIKKKETQTDKSSSYKLPAYISVTEFASPKTYFGKR
jgi:hypothetical protein